MAFCKCWRGGEGANGWPYGTNPNVNTPQYRVLIGLNLGAPVFLQYMTTYLASGMATVSPGNVFPTLVDCPWVNNPWTLFLSLSFPRLSFFSFFFFSREQFVSTLNHFLPPFQPHYSFTPFSAILCIASPLTLDISLFRFTRPYSHSGSDILSFIYKYSIFRFH